MIYHKVGNHHYLNYRLNNGDYRSKTYSVGAFLVVSIRGIEKLSALFFVYPQPNYEQYNRPLYPFIIFSL
ncbi:hypothetical protein [Vibrio gallaecicus]|uniref:hypothetical protein n=1 Tax=Vibrio gallaecicus TaxID=552386 RepID=UPI0025B62211|nr:hypothetical protein [Vibrio gallaecicus]MDN3615781.1 hypothetical protein [Vibrio gallaecicus]MDN3617034.1 hypothetical protein [Vibrio gallaecicus]